MFNNLSVNNHLSKGRFVHIAADLRHPFERDRDRVLHSTAFRKLKDKTQVFMFEKGDYYRNRLTHTLEVCQLARSLSRRLGLNEDLSETIALCHDLGHTPFGHAGEEVITKYLDKSFNHNIQSFRQVTLLENKYIDYSGLNLSWETLDGIVKHNGPVLNPTYDYNLSKEFSFNLSLNPSLEAQVASLCDDIAYIAHDFDDALRSQAISINQIKDFNPLYDFSSYEFKEFNNENIFRNNLTRFLINYLILDIFEQTKLNIIESNLIHPDEVVMHKNFLVSFSEKSNILVKELKNFLHNNFYNSQIVQKGKIEAQKIIHFSIEFLINDYSTLPENWQSKITNQDIKKRVIIDYICGMTDQFAIRFYEKHA